MDQKCFLIYRNAEGDIDFNCFIQLDAYFEDNGNVVKRGRYFLPMSFFLSSASNLSAKEIVENLKCDNPQKVELFLCNKDLIVGEKFITTWGTIHTFMGFAPNKMVKDETGNLTHEDCCARIVQELTPDNYGLLQNLPNADDFKEYFSP